MSRIYLTYCFLFFLAGLWGQTPTRINAGKLVEKSSVPGQFQVSDVNNEFQVLNGLLWNGSNLEIAGDEVLHEGNFVDELWNHKTTKNISILDFAITKNGGNGGIKFSQNGNVVIQNEDVITFSKTGNIANEFDFLFGTQGAFGAESNFYAVIDSDNSENRARFEIGANGLVGSSEYVQLIKIFEDKLESLIPIESVLFQCELDAANSVIQSNNNLVSFSDAGLTIYNENQNNESVSLYFANRKSQREIFAITQEHVSPFLSDLVFRTRVSSSANKEVFRLSSSAVTFPLLDTLASNDFAVFDGGKIGYRNIELIENYILSKKLKTEGNWLSGDGDNEGISITNTGLTKIEVPSGLKVLELKQTGNTNINFYSQQNNFSVLNDAFDGFVVGDNQLSLDIGNITFEFNDGGTFRLPSLGDAPSLNSQGSLYYLNDTKDRLVLQVNETGLSENKPLAFAEEARHSYWSAFGSGTYTGGQFNAVDLNANDFESESIIDLGANIITIPKTGVYQFMVRTRIGSGSFVAGSTIVCRIQDADFGNDLASWTHQYNSANENWTHVIMLQCTEGQNVRTTIEHTSAGQHNISTIFQGNFIGN